MKYLSVFFFFRLNCTQTPSGIKNNKVVAGDDQTFVGLLVPELGLQLAFPQIHFPDAEAIFFGRPHVIIIAGNIKRKPLYAVSLSFA